MKIKIIVAFDDNGAIGRNNDLMWNLPNDMKSFKELTNGHVVVMGRKTFESIPEKYRPLPNRENVVLTANVNWKHDNVLVFHNVKDILQHYNDSGKTLFIIGGGQIYHRFIGSGFVDEIYATHVHTECENADTHINLENFIIPEWKFDTILKQEIDEKHAHSFYIYHITRS